MIQTRNRKKKRHKDSDKRKERTQRKTGRQDDKKRQKTKKKKKTKEEERKVKKMHNTVFINIVGLPFARYFNRSQTHRVILPNATLSIKREQTITALA